MSMVNTPLTYVLFSAWPLAIGAVSLFYCGECLGLPFPKSYLTSCSYEHLLILRVRPSIQATNVVNPSQS